MPDRQCPVCGTALPPRRTFCRLSCRIEADKRNRRLPLTELTLESEWPAAKARREHASEMETCAGSSETRSLGADVEVNRD